MQQKKRVAWLLPVLAVLFFSCNQQNEKVETVDSTIIPTKPVNQPQQKPVDKSVLAGNWTRTDAAYRIQITSMAEDGNMKAGYFNPNSIHVARAQWTGNRDSLKIYLELRDVNYPGSKYTLSYIPGTDMLSGEYYQAVEGTTYKVDFARTK